MKHLNDLFNSSRLYSGDPILSILSIHYVKIGDLKRWTVFKPMFKVSIKLLIREDGCMVIRDDYVREII